MSSHLSGSHRRSADNNNSRERHNRTKDSGNNGNNSTDYSSTTAGNGGPSRTRGQSTNDNQVKEAIIDLYLKVKIGSKNEVSLQTQILESMIPNLSQFLSRLSHQNTHNYPLKCVEVK